MKFFRTKSLIAILFFCLGFLGGQTFAKFRGLAHDPTEPAERFAINPDDFDAERMLEAMSRSDLSLEDSDLKGGSVLGMISIREEKDNIFYDIPSANVDGVHHKLKVEINDGVISITENIKDESNGILETSAQRMFTIAPELDSEKAEVTNEKDRIVIKIPKKK